MSVGAPGESLDSLLDMIANIVGVMLVVLAVAHLTAPAIVAHRRARVPSAPAQTTTAATSRATDLEAELVRRRAAWQAVRGQYLYDDATLRSLGASIDRLRGPAGAREPGQPDTSPDVPRRLREQIRALEQSIADARVRVADLGARVAEAQPEPIQDSDTSLRVPDPRDVREGTRPLTFLCRHGRIVALDETRVLQPLERALLRATATSSLDDAMASASYDTMVNAFTTGEHGTAEFYWRFRDTRLVHRTTHAVNRELIGTLAWRSPEVGETTAEIVEDKSAFRRMLATGNPAECYCKFVVWADSFATYQQARALAERGGFDSGWILMAAEEEHQVVIAAHVEVPPRAPAPPKTMVARRILVGGGGFRIGGGGGGGGGGAAAGGGASVGLGGGGAFKVD